MVDWEDLRHFAAFAEAGTLAGAARSLRVEHATIARRVQALEAQLGVKLIDRRGRKLELTATGMRVASRLQEVKERMLGIERIAAADREELRGPVSLSAPPALAAALLGPILGQLRAAHPGIQLIVVGESREASLDRREADLAIRLERPPKGELLIRKIADVLFRPYAHPAYLSATPDQAWTFIGYAASLEQSPQQRALESVAGDRPIVARASTLEVQAALAEAEVGIAMLPEFSTSGRHLIPVGDVAVSREVWLVVHADLRDSAPVRAASEHLAAGLADALRASDRARPLRPADTGPPA